MPEQDNTASVRLIRAGHDITIKRYRAVDRYALIEQENNREADSVIILLNSEIPNFIECLQQHIENIRR